MSTPQTPPSISVRGGAGSIDARYDDIERLGRLYSDVGGRLASAAWDDKLEAADGDLLASAPLAPRTFAEAEGAILEATYGPKGLAARALVIEAESFCFVAVVEIYRTADELRRAALESVSYGLGFVVGVTLPSVALTGGVAYLGLHVLAPEQADELKAWLGAEGMDLLEEHPEVVELLVNGGGGLLDGLGANPLSAPLLDVLGLDGFHPTTGAAADDLGDLLFGDYHGELNPDYDGPQFDLHPPHDTQDLMHDLATVNDGQDGVITVQKIAGADGTVRWIVDLPGTDRFMDEHTIRNMGSNMNLIAGDDTAYGEAIRTAMEQAGVRPGDPVMLVGHSQGGMQAAALAADPDFPYHVTNVVTAGSPIATSGIPDHVHVLSLENSADVVPHTDGEANPATADHVTVTANSPHGSVTANHDLGVYEGIAEAVDHSSDPSVQAALGSMDGFFDGGEGSSTITYQTQQGDQIRPAGINDPLEMALNIIF